ncbi:nose resistant to fluoxetine protein 6-like [Battus philenor]|uniref:nose resistant to fluoxetine protein 6-like n=1 Tax=Battus philenor TaxID=42288 RepID=UPI0035D0B896
MMITFLIFLYIVRVCSGVIYDLNETEYERMPPLFHLDNYESCLRKGMEPYCLARFDLFSDSPNDLLNLIKEYSEFEVKHYNHTYIERGVCIGKCKRYMKSSDTNKDQDLKSVLEACINETIWKDFGLQAKLSHIYYCDGQIKETVLDSGDWLFGTTLLVLILVNIVASVYAIRYKNKQTDDNHNCGNQYLLCFSLLSNWNDLLSTEIKDERNNNLRGLNGLRFFINFLIPIVHVMWLVGNGFTDNPRELEKSSEKVHYQLIFSGMGVVQAYFVMSSFLMVYKLQILSETTQITWSSFYKILIFRWLRLTPMYALMIAFTMTWMRHFGSGPLWNLYVTGVITDCRNYWWAHLLYINNYIHDDKACAVQSWHIASDMQVFCLGLLVYLAISSSSRKVKTIVLLLLLFLSTIPPAAHVWFQDLDAILLLKPEFYRTFTGDTFRYLYVLGHNNITCFIIGMMAGYFAYSCQKVQFNPLKSKIWKYLTWCIIPAVLFIILSGQTFYADAERRSLVFRVLYAAVHRGTFGILTAFLILGFVFQVENIQRPIFEWNGWTMLSKLTYCSYLLHLNIIHIMMGVRTQLTHVSFFYVVMSHLGVVTLSYLISIPFYVMVEKPFAKLAKILYERRIESINDNKEKKL